MVMTNNAESEHNMFFIGIDGGGTKTKFALYDENGKMLADSLHDTADHWQYGSEKLKRVLEAGVNSVLGQADVNFDDIAAIGFGMAGFGEDKNKDKESSDICRKFFKDIPLAIENDVHVAYVGAFGYEPGIHVVAGTGSMAFGMDDKGNTARCGGWGHEIGDEGSGYWLGKKTMEIFTKQADSRMKKSFLYKMVKERLNIDDDFEIMAVFQDEYFTDRTKTASLQRILLDAAKAGDKYAIKAYKDSVSELAALAIAIRDGLDFSVPIKISYTGGLFNIEEFILKPFMRLTSDKGFIVSKPIFTPVEGAVILAAEKVNKHNKLVGKLLDKVY